MLLLRPELLNSFFPKDHAVMALLIGDLITIFLCILVILIYFMTQKTLDI